MKTTCNRCQTTMRITVAQLKYAGGRVRCGVCLSPFDALSTLEDEVEELPAPTSAAHSTSALQRLLVRTQNLGNTTDRATINPEPSLTQATVKPISDNNHSRITTQVNISPQHDSTAKQAHESPDKTPLQSGVTATQTIFPSPSNDTSIPQQGVLFETPNHHRFTKFYSGLLIILVLVVIYQCFMIIGSLKTNTPLPSFIKSLMLPIAPYTNAFSQKLCRGEHCASLSTPSEINDSDNVPLLEYYELLTVPGLAGYKTLLFTLKNKKNEDTPLPFVKLVLYNTEGQVAFVRWFSPSQYAPELKVLSPLQDVERQLWLKIPEQTFRSYDVVLSTSIQIDEAPIINKDSINTQAPSSLPSF